MPEAAVVRQRVVQHRVAATARPLRLVVAPLLPANQHDFFPSNDTPGGENDGTHIQRKKEAQMGEKTVAVALHRGGVLGQAPLPVGAAVQALPLREVKKI